MSEPPAPTVATPIANVIAETRTMSMPTSSAPCGFTAAALIARPLQLRARNSHSPARTTTASPQAYTCAFGSTMSETWKDWVKYGGGGGGGGGAPHGPPPAPPTRG